MLFVKDKQVWIQALKARWLEQRNIQLGVLRLDDIHPIVSGNKWFKLHYYLDEAIAQGHDTIATFGGAYSNHIVAAACACHALQLKSIGIIRGEQPPELSYTLLHAKSYGMQLQFVSRDSYRHKEELKTLFPRAYWVNEGGYGIRGAEGASLLMAHVPQLSQYTHIICAVGTGTTLAGIILNALPHQTIIGISSLKAHLNLKKEIQLLLPPALQHRAFYIAHGFHFGGYARHTATLLEYMNDVWKEHRMPTDFVYTAKAMYGTEAMICQQIIPEGSRVLLLHTGGLQGNLSLPPGTLAF